MQRSMFKRFTALMLAGGSIASLTASVSARTQEVPDRRQFNIPAQDLSTALEAFGQQSGKQILFDHGQVAGKRSNSVKGSFESANALRRLLSQTGLSMRLANPDTYLVEIVPPLADGDESEAPKQDIVVTGSRIRGAPIASPVITLTQRQLQDAGYSNFRDVIRDIPQNSSGGQNPGVGVGVPGFANTNLNSASTLNLRGLGPDATLTLLNGHRLAYGGSAQGIDISTVPLDALDRVEIVSDGASAIYGSDAVGGVANIILKRDYEGVSTTARFGGSTDGGNDQQQYSGVAGTRWESGGIIATYNFERDTPVSASQRSYTSTLYPDNTLLPYQKRHSALVSAHQKIGPDIEFKIDSLFSKLNTSRDFSLNSADAFTYYGEEISARTKTLAISPSIKVDLSRNWSLTVDGVYGKDTAHYNVPFYYNGSLNSTTRGCYCNQTRQIEADAEGGLLDLPGGQVRLAIGGGYRSNSLHAYRVGTSFDFSGTQSSYYGFGEAYLPLVSSTQSIPFIERLSVTVAGRFEDYPGMDHVATPKLGVIYAPSLDIDIKGSWGKSFKAPTLYQQNVAPAVEYDLASDLGGTGYASTATALIRESGNSSLKPERATTWTISAAAHPRALPGARLEIGYFHILYRDRIVDPLQYFSEALSNPIYADLVTYSPSDELKSQVVTLAGANFYNDIGTGYDPTTVIAVIDDRYMNVAKQTIHGIDVNASYSLHLGKFGSLIAMGDASYLYSTQKLSADQPSIALAGTIFNPPHYRGHASVTWNHGPITVTSAANYIGGVTDNQKTPYLHVSGMTTWDMALRYENKVGPSLTRNIEFTLSAQNLLNAKPSIIRTEAAFYTPYDSTNYSAVGRFVAFSVTKHW